MRPEHRQKSFSLPTPPAVSWLDFVLPVRLLKRPLTSFFHKNFLSRSLETDIRR